MVTKSVRLVIIHALLVQISKNVSHVQLTHQEQLIKINQNVCAQMVIMIQEQPNVSYAHRIAQLALEVLLIVPHALNYIM